MLPTVEFKTASPKISSADSLTHWEKERGNYEGTRVRRSVARSRMCVTRRLYDDDSSPRGYFMPVWRRVDHALPDEMDQTGPEMLFALQILQRPHNFASILLSF